MQNKRVALFLILAFCISLGAVAAPAELIPREVLFGNPERTAPAISPDGKRLAYLAPHKGVLNVWVRTIGQTDDKVITADKKRGIRFFFWQRDGQHIIYNQDSDGDENFHAYQTNLVTRLTRDLTPFEGVRIQNIMMEQTIPNQILVELNMPDAKRFDVYRVNLTNGAVEMDTKNPGDVVSFIADNKLQVRAAQAFTHDGGFVIRVRDSNKSAWRDLMKWGPEEAFGGVLGFSADRQALRVISSVDANAARLIEVNLKTKKRSVLADDPIYDVGEVRINPYNKDIEAVAFARDRIEWQVVNPRVKADFAAIQKIRGGDVRVRSSDKDNRIWIVADVKDDAPTAFYAYERATRKATLLFTERPNIEKYVLSSTKPITFKARDGLTIHGYLTLPREHVEGKMPLVLKVHGGPWARDEWGFNGIAQWLANRGYAVLEVNFRGSSGYGKAFLNAGDREWGAKMQDDLSDAVRWAVQGGIADGKKVCIFGGSYGGYATLAGLAFTPNLFSCGVDIVGPSNLVTLLNSLPPYWTNMVAIFHKRVGNPKTDEAFLKSRSPLFSADKIVAPFIVAQGANDPRVKQAESEQIVNAVRAKGKAVDYLLFPDEGHGFARPENRLAFYAATEAFLAKMLGGRVEDPSASEKELLANVRK